MAKNSANYFRFLPGRKEANADGKILFGGARYSRNAVPDDKLGFLAGIAVGPGQHMNKDSAGPGFAMSPGGVLIPAYPSEKRETIEVREFTPKADKTGKPKQYVDWATFQQFGEGALRVVPYCEEGVAYFEIWTGDYDQSEAAYQLIQASMFTHGSVAYAASASAPVIDAGYKKPRKSKRSGAIVADEPEPEIRDSKAELVGERRGEVVAGIPLWIARVYRVHYSAKESEAVLVRQLDKFYLILIKDQAVEYREVPASRFERQFENLTIDQQLVPIAA